jgi:predicted DNA-binding transcriptional regulator YafY
MEQKLPWSVSRRLEFIEFRLYWEGRVNRTDLVRQFNISLQQASADLTRYQELAGDNIQYDKTAKTYIAASTFQPAIFTPSADTYFARLRMLAANVLVREDSWLDRSPPFAAVPLLRRRIEPDVARRILIASRRREAIHIQYQSFSTPEPIWRWIAPHACGFDGFRWHVRAWCYKHDDFRDFVMSRIFSCTDTRASSIDQHKDIEWSTIVSLLIGPHPDLEIGIRKAIELDFGMNDGCLEIRLQLALVYYFERLHGLDLDPQCIPGSRQHLVLVNRDEVNAIRKNVHSKLISGK